MKRKMFSPVALIYILANLLYFVYERSVPSQFFYDFVVNYVLLLTLYECVVCSVSMTSIPILLVVQVNCLLDFFCFTAKELHALNNYHVIRMKVFLIRVKIVLVLH